MPWQWSLSVLVLLTAAAIAATCALSGVTSIRRRGVRRHVVAFVALCLPIVFWCGVYAVQIATPTFAGELIAHKVLTLAIIAFAPAWIGFVLTYTGRERHRRVTVVISVVLLGVSLVLWVVTLVTGTRAPVLRGAHLIKRGSHAFLVTDLGPIGVLYAAYIYGSFLVGAWWLVEYALHAPAAGYRRSALTVVALAVPITVGVLRVFGVVPVAGIDLAPVSMMVSAVLFGVAVFRYRLFDVVPVAWEAVLAQVQDGVLVLDDRERIVEANAAAGSLAPGPAALVGASASDRLPEYDRLRESGTVVAERGERAVEYERSPLRLTGETRGWVVISRDVTDRERRRAALEDENTRLDAFAFVVTHDLRNPLTVIDGYAAVAAETGDPAAFDTIHDTVERMDDFLEELLTLSRDGETIADVEAVSIAAIARDAHAALDDATLGLDVGTDAVVLADPTRLRQVFDNLLRNARDHNDGPMTARVGALSDGFFVEDDGGGLGLDDRDTVFETGFTTRAGGSGFGLAIVSDVIDAHGWTIAAGDADGGGARFDVRGVEFDDETAFRG